MTKKNNKKKDEEKKNNKENDKPKKKSIILIIKKNNNQCSFCTDPNCKNNCNKDKEDPKKKSDDENENEPEDEDEPDDPDDPDYDDMNYDDFYNDLYEEELRREELRREEEERRNKSKRKIDDILSPLNFLFENIISEKINKKHKPSDENVDDFNNYFKEADVLIPITKSIKDLKDLIELGNSYDPLDKNRYVINLKALNKCVKPLEELNSMIGMKNIKQMIIDLIFFKLQNLEDKKEELWHLVIEGTPGSGKTEIAKIIGKLYFSLGITKKDKFSLVKRSDLIGKYLGHTAKMTQQVFDDAKGGILFIDEAYSLGNPEQRDSFSKECIDTINQNLTENRETVVFIAGYKDQLNESFFSYNPGLNRRFKMRLSVDKYSGADLREIFLKKIKENEWGILNDNSEKEIPLFFFEKNIKLFKYNGGDMENLWHLAKICHSRRIFGKPVELLKKINSEDLESALKLYCDNDEVKGRNESMSEYLANSMYC